MITIIKAECLAVVAAPVAPVDWIVRRLKHAQQKSRLEDAARVMLKKVNQGELLMERRLTAENVKEALGQFPGLDMDCL